MNSAAPRRKLAFPGLILIALTAVLLAASCADSVVVGDACDDGLTTCSGECTDTQTDPGNCGACDNACPPDGACEAGGCVAECSATLTNCNGSCVDIQTDEAHCGDCDLACPDGLECAGGVCQAGCPGGLTQCSGLCVNTQTDTGNCGGCGVVCAPNEACNQGACGNCPSGQTSCNGVCVDTQTNPQHCGGCGLACAPGFSCVGGICDNPCETGLSYCNGSCVDTLTDNQHCGFCNNACAGAQSCQAGTCVCPGGVCGLCGITDLGSMVPQTTNGSTIGVFDGYAPQCNGPGAGEAAFSFTAPADATYNFNTFGSGYDTVIAAVTPACLEVACNDDTQGLQSKVTVNLTQNQSIIIVVDGFSGDEGFFTLNIGQSQPPMCPTTNIGSMVPQTATGTTINAGDALTPSCGFGQSGDVSFEFTAPADGTYSFDTFGSFFNTVLHVLNGNCTGPELACNDDANFNGESKATVTLLQGQTVIIGVEGLFGDEGDVVLNVNQAVPPMCPTGNLGSTVPQTVTGSTAGQGDALTPSCGSLPSADNSYTFTAPSTDVYVIDTFGSAFNTVLHVHDVSCTGPELACNDDWQFTLESKVMVSLTAGQTVVIGIDGSGGEEGAYVLNIDKFVPPPCPMMNLGSTVPQTVSGDTTGLDDYLTPMCGAPGGPEFTYSFTAPANGMYTFDTFGSVYDTILHVHNATCLGPELTCNDDAGAGLQSQVSVSLVAGQTVIIAVDGFGGDAGPFTLHIN